MAEPAGDLTYAEVGGTLAAAMPAGYHHLELRRRVGGPELLDALGEAIGTWALQRGAGLRVPSEPVAEGASYVLGLGPLRIPVRVVRVVDEPDRRGFAYGTLPGHPEVGEEAFLAERDAEGTWVRVRAFSRPGRWYTRLGGPLARLAQQVGCEAYVRAAQRAVRAR